MLTDQDVRILYTVRAFGQNMKVLKLWTFIRKHAMRYPLYFKTLILPNFKYTMQIPYWT